MRKARKAKNKTISVSQRKNVRKQNISTQMYLKLNIDLKVSYKNKK